MSRRALFSFGLSRIRRELPGADELPPRRERPPAEADDRLIAAIEEADLHRLSEAPARALLDLVPPPPGEDVLVVGAEHLDEALAGLTQSLLAVADAGEVGDLPFEDGDFGAVLAPYAASFWPATNIAVTELFRVLRPGGTLAVASWTGEGAVGRLLSAASDWDPALPPTLTWSSEGQVRTRLEVHADEITFSHCEVECEFLSAPAAAAGLERALPPVAAALAGFPGADGNGLRAHAARLVEEEGGPSVRGRALLAAARKRA